MLLLLLFALVAGAGTAITPCVLPVLPAMLSASALGGRRRPLGIVLGLAITFLIAIVALAQITKGIGLAAGATRTIAVIVLIAFGVLLLIPQAAARIQAPLSRLARFGPSSRGDGFWSGLAGRRRARLRLRAVRGPDPGRGDLGQRLGQHERPRDRGRDRVRDRPQRGAAAVGARRSQGRRRRSAGTRKGYVVERDARSGAAPDRDRDGVQPRRAFREHARPGRQPAVVPRRPDPFARELERRAEPAGVAAPAVAIRHPPGEGGGDQADAAGGRGRDPGRRAPRRFPNLGPAPEFTDTQRWFNTPGGAAR